MISKLVQDDPELSAEQIKVSIDHVVYRMALLTSEDNPLDDTDRKAIGCLWLVNAKLKLLIEQLTCTAFLFVLIL